MSASILAFKRRRKAGAPSPTTPETNGPAVSQFKTALEHLCHIHLYDRESFNVVTEVLSRFAAAADWEPRGDGGA